MPTRTRTTPTHARGAPPPSSGPHENQPNKPELPQQQANLVLPDLDSSRSPDHPEDDDDPEKEKAKEKEGEEGEENVNEDSELEKRSKMQRRVALHPTLTPHQRRTYQALLSVPRGRWTTYSALATHVHSSARAVGTAMRSNPFAPDVPCHRVLAADRSLGGYKGDSPHNNKSRGHLQEKRSILEGEGVRFDHGGKALGVVFVKFSS